MMSEPVKQGRRLLMDFQQADLSFSVDLLRFSCDWAKKQGYKDARIENISGGYRITVESP